MGKRLPLIVLAFYLALVSLSFTSCTNELTTDSNGTSISGYWKSAYGDGFEISGTSFKQYDDTAKGISFAGTIVNNSNMNASSGFITIKITNPGTWQKTLDKYYVIRWKNLSATGISESTAYSAAPGANNSGLDTQSLAEAEYTEANGYFPGAYYGDYIKQ